MRCSHRVVIVALSICVMAQAVLSFEGDCLAQLGRYARGWSEAVAVNGDGFVFGDGSALVILRSDGSTTEIETGAMVVGLDVVDDYVYVVGDGGLKIVDLLAPGGPLVVGRCVMPGVAESVEVHDGLAYVAGGEWGMRVVDVRVPADPVELGVVDTAEWAADAAVGVADGTPVAVVADSRSGLVVVDAGDSEELEVVSYVDIDTGGGAVEVADSHAMAINGSGGVLSAVDISTPSDPEVLGALELGDGSLRQSALAVDGDYAYVVGKNFFVIDVSDPRYMTRTSETDISGSGYDIAASEGRVAVATGILIHFIDASDAQNPVEGEPFQVREHDIGGAGITATDRHVIGFSKDRFVIGADNDYTPGLRIFDVDDSRHPFLAGEFLQDHLIGDAEARGTLVYVVTYDGFFRVIDLADVAQPQELGVVSLPSSWQTDVGFMDLDVDDHLAVVVGPDGLVVIDITDPSNPTRMGEIGQGFPHVELVGDSAYVSIDDTIRLVDVADPSDPFLVDDDRHRLEMYGFVSDIEVSDGYAYVVSDVGGAFLSVVDLDASAGWVEVGFALAAGWSNYYQAGVVSLSGNQLLLSLREQDVRHRGRLSVFDISDPTGPQMLAETVIPGAESAALLDGGKVYVNDDIGGLAIYDDLQCRLRQRMPREIQAPPIE